MRALLVAFAVLVFSSPTQAQVLAGDPCPDAQTIIDRLECAQKVLAKADADLNRTWKRVLAEHPSGGDRASHRDEIRDAQRAWIKFRDLDCEAASQIGIPKYWELNRIGCQIAHTRARTRALRELYVE